MAVPVNVVPVLHCCSSKAVRAMDTTNRYFSYNRVFSPFLPFSVFVCGNKNLCGNGEFVCVVIKNELIAASQSEPCI